MKGTILRGDRQKADFNENDYHNFGQLSRGLGLPRECEAGSVRDGVGWEALTAPQRIEWNTGDEFEAARKASGR